MSCEKDIHLPASAQRALDALDGAGYAAWCVGGFVRDALCGAPGHDVDLATPSPWPETASILREAGMAVHETGTDFGTVTAIADGEPIEITTFRSDCDYRDARHPETVAPVASIEEDLARRDFTINAMAFRPDWGVCDPYGGQDDLADGLIRAVGDARERFSEDALRILRGLRLASQLDFCLDPDTLAGMRECSPLLQQVAVERIRQELDRLLLGPGVARVLVEYFDLLCAALPELAGMADCPQNTPYHIYDVLGHTACVVEMSPPTPLSRWAALLHDSGKPATRSTDSRGQDHFFGHPEEGAALTHRLAKRLHMPRLFSDELELLVGYHEWFFPPTERKALAALQRFGGKVELYRTLLELQVADNQAKATTHTERLENALARIKALDAALASQRPYTRAHLAVNGRDLIEEAGYQPGTALGTALEALLEAVMDGVVENDRGALLALAATIREQDLAMEFDETQRA